MSSCISWIRIYCCIYILDQDILLYPGYTAGRAGGANPAAGHGTTPGPGCGAGGVTPGPGCGAGRVTPGPDLNNR